MSRILVPLFFPIITDFSDERHKSELDGISKSEDLLKYISEQYLKTANIVYVQGLFLACKADKLYDISVEYAYSLRKQPITFFERKPTRLSSGKR